MPLEFCTEIGASPHWCFMQQISLINAHAINIVIVRYTSSLDITQVLSIDLHFPGILFGTCIMVFALNILLELNILLRSFYLILSHFI